MRDADVVVSHAGVGTALAAFGVGKCPLLVPRRASFREHVDDHQKQIATELVNRGLSMAVDADDLDYDDIVAASRKRVTMRTDAPPFVTANA
jgi:UDP-N-acetylglucosamine transferase subunit ALG13